MEDSRDRVSAFASCVRKEFTSFPRVGPWLSTSNMGPSWSSLDAKSDNAASEVAFCFPLDDAFRFPDVRSVDGPAIASFEETLFEGRGIVFEVLSVEEGLRLSGMADNCGQGTAFDGL